MVMHLSPHFRFAARWAAWRALAAGLCLLGPTGKVHSFEQEVLRGRVLDGRTGQAIEKARVFTGTEATSTDKEGRFTLAVKDGASVEVSVSAVGYSVARKTVSPGAGELEFYLGQDAVAYAETLDVRPAVFDEDRNAPLAQSLLGVEQRNLASVVADDVLRSVQTLPGVSSGDDFYGTFSVRGWGFENSGLYIDGVLVNSPFHTVRDVNDSFSLTILNNDVIEGVTLMNGGAPARYGDRVGAVLNIETRDGSREKTSVRANAGATGVSLFAEGPIGHSGTSWLLGARKSFLDYVINAIQDNPTFVFGYYDVQGKLSHSRGPHVLSLFLLHGSSDYEDNESTLGRNDVARALAATQLLSARWRWTPSERTFFSLSGFLSRETGRNRNLRSEDLFDGTSSQSGGRVDLTRKLGSTHELQAGLLARNLAVDATEASYPRAGPSFDRLSYSRNQWQPGGYLQDAWRSSSGRLSLNAGVRFDRASVPKGTFFLPRASGVFRVSDRSSVSFAVGSYAQFPTLEALFGSNGNEKLAAEESDHFNLGFEHTLSPTLRLRAQVYDQEERYRLRTGREVRIQDGEIEVIGDRSPQNALSGRSKGVEFQIQRRSPNGVTGWMSYAIGRTQVRDAATGDTFDSDHDQRHTLNTYLSYRISDRTNLSLKFRYGSNVPIAGYFQRTISGYRVGEERNRIRIPSYSRLDVRANRTFSVARARLTGFLEILNVLNHSNYRYGSINIAFPSAQVFFDRERMFPFLPAAGITVEW